MRVRLLDIAHARSGDKGSHANVGVIAYQPEWFPVLARHLTAEVVAAHMAPLVRGKVERFELPNLSALNFVLYDALDGGGTRSLRIDAQGKVLSTAVLRLVLEIPDAEAHEHHLPAGEK
ncbi:MAG: hypothetical protein FJ202_05410 [Gemmatimonadetes bacterium]|nr:hypothetical protein [Gemmatimonadota bacterium]